MLWQRCWSTYAQQGTHSLDQATILTQDSLSQVQEQGREGTDLQPRSSHESHEGDSVSRRE